jgi:exportin-1
MNLNAEFGLIFQLCQYVLGASADPALLNTSLSTLQRFLSWIPIGFIFETNLLELLAVKVLFSSCFFLSFLIYNIVVPTRAAISK